MKNQEPKANNDKRQWRLSPVTLLGADSTAPKIATLEEAMNAESPLNEYFHAKFGEVTKGMTFTDESSKNITKQIAFLFYLQGQAHFKKWASA